MKRMSLKEYAVKHKMSLFSAMKLVKSGKVKSEIVDEDGREVTYILEDNETLLATEKSEKVEKIELSVEDQLKELKEELHNLKGELREVKSLLHRLS